MALVNRSFPSENNDGLKVGQGIKIQTSGTNFGQPWVDLVSIYMYKPRETERERREGRERENERGREAGEISKREGEGEREGERGIAKRGRGGNSKEREGERV